VEELARVVDVLAPQQVADDLHALVHAAPARRGVDAAHLQLVGVLAAGRQVTDGEPVRHARIIADHRRPVDDRAIEEHGATAGDRVQLWLVSNHNCPEKRLLDAQSADRPGDHELLDLLGALEDVVGLLVAFGNSASPARRCVLVRPLLVDPGNRVEL
jgi:hypothetical protein